MSEDFSVAEIEGTFCIVRGEKIIAWMADGKLNPPVRRGAECTECRRDVRDVADMIAEAANGYLRTLRGLGYDGLRKESLCTGVLGKDMTDSFLKRGEHE